MAMTDEKKIELLTQLSLRTGTCTALLCKERCEEFTFEKHQDGFALCACGHTQNSHAVPDEEESVQ